MSPRLQPVAGDGTVDPGLYELPDESERPCFVVVDEWAIAKGRERKLRPGVYLCTMTKGTQDNPPTPVETWICGPLHIEAQTLDDAGENYGRLLRFQTSTGRWRLWAMPQELLAGSCEEVRRELLAMGLVINPKHRATFGEYLASKTPRRTMRCTLSTGWVGRHAFVLPDGVIGPGANGVIFQSAERGGDGHGTKGTLDDWRQRVAALAVGNAWVMVAISAAFVGPLLERCNVEGGGLHLFGDSSTAKTTTLEAARSVWGGPDFRRQWRATSNGLEGLATLHNDLLLPLDEIGECDGRALGEVAYMLANGVGKSRASRSGAARAAKRWRTFVLSTGEATMPAHMLKAGVRPNAGQSVRMLDLPAKRRFGIFDELHGRVSGRALADELKSAAGSYYGTVGRAFLEHLTTDERDFRALLEGAKAAPLFDAAEGQEARAASRFALIGLAGELATEFGLTGWEECDAITAAGLAFEAWREHRGRGQDEPTKVLEALADFVDRHGDARFETIYSDNQPVVRDRAGWREDSIYYFSTSGLREALPGYDLKLAVATLIDKGVIPPPKEGKSAVLKKIKGRVSRVYAVNVDALREAVDGR